METHHINEAMAQVRRMQEVLLERRRFRGYSGWARLFSGGMALAVTVALSSDRIPSQPGVHLAGWGLVLAAALAANYGALAGWFFSQRGADRNVRELKPAREALWPLAVGAVLTATLIRVGEYDLLYGAWMTCYGLAHLPYRLTLPAGNYWLGVGYLLCGAACLMLPAVTLLNPWPMGVVFFIGESFGGALLLWDEHKRREDLP